MSVVGTTFSNSSAQQIVLGDVLGRVSSGRLGAVPEPIPDLETIEPTSQEERREEVTHLARTLTRQSSRHDPNHNLFDYQKDSYLDPYSPNFDARKYTKTLAKIGRETAPGRTSGISYKNLSVHGYGSDAGMLCHHPVSGRC